MRIPDQCRHASNATAACMSLAFPPRAALFPTLGLNLSTFDRFSFPTPSCPKRILRRVLLTPLFPFDRKNAGGGYPPNKTPNSPPRHDPLPHFRSALASADLRSPFSFCALRFLCVHSSFRFPLLAVRRPPGPATRHSPRMSARRHFTVPPPSNAGIERHVARE